MCRHCVYLLISYGKIMLWIDQNRLCILVPRVGRTVCVLVFCTRPTWQLSVREKGLCWRCVTVFWVAALSVGSIVFRDKQKRFGEVGVFNVSFWRSKNFFTHFFFLKKVYHSFVFDCISSQTNESRIAFSQKPFRVYLIVIFNIDPL